MRSDSRRSPLPDDVRRDPRGHVGGGRRELGISVRSGGGASYSNGVKQSMPRTRSFLGCFEVACTYSLIAFTRRVSSTPTCSGRSRIAHTFCLLAQTCCVFPLVRTMAPEPMLLYTLTHLRYSLLLLPRDQGQVARVDKATAIPPWIASPLPNRSGSATAVSSLAGTVRRFPLRSLSLSQKSKDTHPGGHYFSYSVQRRRFMLLRQSQCHSGKGALALRRMSDVHVLVLRVYKVILSTSPAVSRASMLLHSRIGESL